MPMAAHAVVDPAGAQAGLGDHEAVAFLADQVADRHPHIAKQHL